MSTPADVGPPTQAPVGPPTQAPVGPPTQAPVGPPTQQSVGDRSLGDLISEVTTDLSTLMRQELELAKAELQQSASRAGKGAGMLGGAAVAGYFVLLFVSIALWWAIGSATGLGWSAVIVAVIWGIIGAVLAVMGRNSLKSVKGLPKTADTVKKIPDALKGSD
jgi:Putative Actinobacterial Holin-X, holin superfamily III